MLEDRHDERHAERNGKNAFTVHTSFRGKENETGNLRLWCSTEKIEARNKAEAKIAALLNIIESGEYSDVTAVRQNARASSRK